MDKRIIPLIFLIGLSLIFSCKVESPRKIQTPTTFPDQVVENTTMFFTVNGVRSEENIYYLTQKCTEFLEQVIRNYPDQWVWMHKRWLRTPDNS